MKIKKITETELRKMLKSETKKGYVPRGLFYLEDYNSAGNKVFVGVDNSTGDAWIEDFTSLEVCKEWLNREISTMQ